MSIGEQLKAARIERGFSLHDVSERMRVRERIIQDIENNRYETSGGNTYAKGHIRTLARLYGMDVAQLMSEFDALVVQEETTMQALLAETNVTVSVEESKPSWKVFGMVASIVVVAVAGFQVVPGIFSSDSRNSIVSVAEDVLGNKDEAPAVASASKGVSIKLTGIDSLSWVKVSGADGATKFEGKIREGQSQEFFDNQLIQLIIGNAGAIAITYNGQDLGTSGKIGEVTRLQFSPDTNSAG
jgi:transcriptional regulator with XRE-family HTH domain